MSGLNNHKPVLLQEILQYIPTNPGGKYFDGTVGYGGHSEAILNKLDSNAVLIGTDKDERAFNFCASKFEKDDRVQIYNTSYANIDVISKLDSIFEFDGMLLDLGVSSPQLDDPMSGFSYKQKSKIDLRMNNKEGMPAYHFLNTLNEDELTKIFREFGEERHSYRIAKKIIETRSNAPITFSDQLVNVIDSVIGKRFLNKTLSRIFQALRIFVNNELDELQSFLSKSIEYLAPGGRLAIISFHSLEDRIVKEFIKYESSDCICPPEAPICICDKQATIKPITKKPIVAGESELNENPRARSAKLRVAEKL